MSKSGSADRGVNRQRLWARRAVQGGCLQARPLGGAMSIGVYGSMGAYRSMGEAYGSKGRRLRGEVNEEVGGDVQRS